MESIVVILGIASLIVGAAVVQRLGEMAREYYVEKRREKRKRELMGEEV